VSCEYRAQLEPGLEDLRFLMCLLQSRASRRSRDARILNVVKYEGCAAARRQLANCTSRSIRSIGVSRPAAGRRLSSSMLLVTLPFLPAGSHEVETVIDRKPV